ncbi:SpoVR family protein [Patescibacteria group bacterium AH-259-L05]|nr:SpoVR family protein [Patescibacteria group bacterium AH-259-L05]
MLSKAEEKRLNELDKVIVEIMKGYGLNVWEQKFDIVSSAKMAEIIAYNSPVSYSYWAGGKGYERIKTIWRHTPVRLPYEVYFSPNRAYLCATDPLAVMMLTMAHVYAHNDFSKNNALMKTQRTDMTPFLARAKKRFAEYAQKYGEKEVEKTIEAARALMFNIDPFAPKRVSRDIQIEKRLSKEKKEHPDVDKKQLRKRLLGQYPFEPDRDILAFLIENSNELEEWQRDILHVVREQGYHLFPIMRTSLINEGWCAYWHEKVILDLFKQKLISNKEFDTFSKYNAGVLSQVRKGLNIYLVGREIWKEIDKTHGREKMFQVRGSYDSSQFVSEFLTDEVIRREKLYIYKKVDAIYITIPLVVDIIEETNPKIFRHALVHALRRYPLPLISIISSNYGNHRVLGLAHHFKEENQELDIEYAENTLQHIYYLWGPPVCLETQKIVGENETKTLLWKYSRKGFKQTIPKGKQLSMSKQLSMFLQKNAKRVP